MKAINTALVVGLNLLGATPLICVEKLAERYQRLGEVLHVVEWVLEKRALEIWPLELTLLLHVRPFLLFVA